VLEETSAVVVELVIELVSVVVVVDPPRNSVTGEHVAAALVNSSMLFVVDVELKGNAISYKLGSVPVLW
jgi:hypothetical protein